MTREQLAEGQKRASDFKPTEVPSLDTQRGEPARKPLADLRATTATGDAQAHKALGETLPAGKGEAAKDSAEAVRWFTCPDNQKQPSGDRAKDEMEASKWYLLALRAKAAAGEAEAQNGLGEAFYAGKLGVVKNAVEAVKWFRQAAGQNLAAAQSNLGICYERGDGVAKYHPGFTEQRPKSRNSDDPFGNCVWYGFTPPEDGKITIKLRYYDAKSLVEKHCIISTGLSP